MKTALFVYLMLLFTEMAVAQKPDTIPVKHLFLQKADTIPQKTKNTLWYVHAPNLSYGNFYMMAGLGFVVMNKQQWGVAFEIKSGTVSAPNTPKDFEPGGFNFLSGDGMPDEKNTVFLLSTIHEFRRNSIKVRPTIQAGLSYAERVYPDNFVYLPPTGGWFDWGASYNYDYRKSKMVGLYLKPSCRYLFTKNIAVSAALWTVLQQKNSYYGIEVGWQFGRLR